MQPNELALHYVAQGDNPDRECGRQEVNRHNEIIPIGNFE